MIYHISDRAKSGFTWVRIVELSGFLADVKGELSDVAAQQNFQRSVDFSGKNRMLHCTTGFPYLKYS
jgi:hypothetical protein